MLSTSPHGGELAQRDDAGFAILETLVALAILAIALGVLLGVFTDGMRWQVLVERYGDAVDRKAWSTGAYRVVVEVIPEDGTPSGALVKLTTLRLGAGEPDR